MAGRQVQPISPVDALLFKREAEFGKMPLVEAFKNLKTDIPALGELEVSVREYSYRNWEKRIGKVLVDKSYLQYAA